MSQTIMCLRLHRYAQKCMWWQDTGIGG